MLGKMDEFGPAWALYLGGMTYRLACAANPDMAGPLPDIAEGVRVTLIPSLVKLPVEKQLAFTRELFLSWVNDYGKESLPPGAYGPGDYARDVLAALAGDPRTILVTPDTRRLEYETASGRVLAVTLTQIPMKNDASEVCVEMDGKRAHVTWDEVCEFLEFSDMRESGEVSDPHASVVTPTGPYVCSLNVGAEGWNITILEKPHEGITKIDPYRVMEWFTLSPKHTADLKRNLDAGIRLRDAYLG